MAAERLEVLFTTNPGIEDVVEAEARARLRAEILESRRGRGRVYALVPAPRLRLVEQMRSIHRARIVLARGRACPAEGCLEDLKRLVKSSGVEEFVTPWTSFAVRAERVGSHDYSSLDVARAAGDAVIEAVRERHGERPPVDLDHPAVIVRVDVVEDEAVVGVELAGDLSWHRRGYRVYDHPAALKPSLAYAMIWLSGARDGDTVADPMCGGGTVAIEAALLFESSRVRCMDRSRRHIRGAVLNAGAAQVRGRIDFIVGDAARMHELMGSVDVLVSNPPYGIRMGSPREIRRLYRRFLASAARAVSKSITLITTEHRTAREALEAEGWRIREDRVVAHGGLWPHIIVAEPG